MLKKGVLSLLPEVKGVRVQAQSNVVPIRKVALVGCQVLLSPPNALFHLQTLVVPAGVHYQYVMMLMMYLLHHQPNMILSPLKSDEDADPAGLRWSVAPRGHYKKLLLTIKNPPHIFLQGLSPHLPYGDLWDGLPMQIECPQ